MTHEASGLRWVERRAFRLTEAVVQRYPPSSILHCGSGTDTQ